MRTRVTRVAVITAVVAMTLFAVPLAVVSRSLLVERELAELQVSALAGTRVVTADPGDPLELPGTDTPTTLTIYGADGRRTAGHGPATAGPAARAALRGSATRGSEGDRIVAAVPVVSNERVIAAVEASESSAEVWRQVALAWAALAAGAVIAVGVGVLVARAQSRRLVRPLEELTDTAVKVAEGDLSRRARPSDVEELDELASAHNAMVESLSTVLERERRFSADASHQLRTPLARLMLRLEAAEADPDTADSEWFSRSRADIAGLQETVADVLSVARIGTSDGRTLIRPEPLGEVLGSAVGRWRVQLAEQGRRLESQVDREVTDLLVSGRVIGHVLDVLLENSLTHGRGRVLVLARPTAEAVAIDVIDGGELAASLLDPLERRGTTGAGAGVGPSGGRTMASAASGRLVMSERRPTRFTLFLPVLVDQLMD